MDLGLKALTDDQFYNLFQQIVEELAQRDPFLRQAAQVKVVDTASKLKAARESMLDHMKTMRINELIRIKVEAERFVTQAVQSGKIRLVSKSEAQDIEKEAFRKTEDRLRLEEEVRLYKLAEAEVLAKEKRKLLDLANAAQDEISEKLSKLLKYPADLHVNVWSKALHGSRQSISNRDGSGRLVPSNVVLDSKTLHPVEDIRVYIDEQPLPFKGAISASQKLASENMLKICYYVTGNSWNAAGTIKIEHTGRSPGVKLKNLIPLLDQYLASPACQRNTQAKKTFRIPKYVDPTERGDVNDALWFKL